MSTKKLEITNKAFDYLREKLSKKTLGVFVNYLTNNKTPLPDDYEWKLYLERQEKYNIPTYGIGFYRNKWNGEYSGIYLDRISHILLFP